ncbi:MAG: sidE [Modestobacter sp.]|nr:sidE [Modestobacter sp.]
MTTATTARGAPAVVQPAVAAPEYGFVSATVARVERLSPSFLRLTLAGPELRSFGVGGEALGPVVHAALCELGVAAPVAGVEPEDVDLVGGILWQVPENGADGCYAWLAGEAGMVKKLRRRLVRDLGVSGTSVAFMGYWRMGASEGS